MTKQDAIDLMIKKVEELERDRLSHQSDPARETVEAIIKAVKGVEVENEN